MNKINFFKINFFKINLFIIFLIIFIGFFISNKQIGFFTSNKQTNKQTKYYFKSNNTTLITLDTFEYVRLYKQQLLKNITKLLDDLNIKFSIANGNLIEYVRNKYIYHDDDLDIRFDVNDLEKWIKYCKNKNNINNKKYNLQFDDRFNDINKQKYNGIQARLITFENENNIKTFSHMDIHIDLVASRVIIPYWVNHDINFDKLQTITYLGIKTYCPNEYDTKKMLKKEYGPNYLKPNIKSKIF